MERHPSPRPSCRQGVPPNRDVSEERTLESMIDSIHHNPVRRGLCERTADWEWSSAQWYAGIRPVRLEIDATLPMTYDS